jgi:hypothetical protein
LQLLFQTMNAACRQITQYILITPFRQASWARNAPGNTMGTVYRHEQDFTIVLSVIAGTVNLTKHEIAISMHGDFIFSVAVIFQSFLFRLYYPSCENRVLESCFIHSSGVIKEDTACSFPPIRKNNG